LMGIAPDDIPSHRTTGSRIARNEPAEHTNIRLIAGGL